MTLTNLALQLSGAHSYHAPQLNNEDQCNAGQNQHARQDVSVTETMLVTNRQTFSIDPTRLRSRRGNQRFFEDDRRQG